MRFGEWARPLSGTTRFRDTMVSRKTGVKSFLQFCRFSFLFPLFYIIWQGSSSHPSSL